MSLISTDKHLVDLVSGLSEAYTIFSNEAVNLSALLARSEAPVSSESYYELRKQCIAEVHAFEEYLNRKEEILAYPSTWNHDRHNRIELRKQYHPSTIIWIVLKERAHPI
jgi:hypothetical protein